MRIAMPFGYFISGELAAVIIIISITLIYFMSLYLFTELGNTSLWFDSRKFGALVYFLVGCSIIFACLIRGRMPGIFLIFTAISIVNLMLSFVRPDDVKASRISMVAIVAPFSLICFVSGILWIDEYYIFKDAVSYAIGIEISDKESMHIGGVALITTGYSFIYKALYA